MTKEQVKYFHPGKVTRVVMQSVPRTAGSTMRAVLYALLSYLNTSGISDDTTKATLIVKGSASHEQLRDSGYEVAEIKKKLKAWRRLGFVDWQKRDDNLGLDFLVYAAPREDVMRKAVVDPARSEQGRRAAAARRDSQDSEYARSAPEYWEQRDLTVSEGFNVDEETS